MTTTKCRLQLYRDFVILLSLGSVMEKITGSIFFSFSFLKMNFDGTG